MVGDAFEDVAQVGLGVEIVELGGADQAIEGGRAFATRIGSGEQVILAIMKAFA